MQSRSLDTVIRFVRRAAPAIVVLALLAVGTVGTVGAGARISVSPNWRLNTQQVPGRGEDSVGLAVDPTNPRHIVEVNADWEAGQCDYHVSFNGGRTWTGGDFRTPAAYEPQPCAVGPHLAENMQAGVVYGSHRNVYATFTSSRILPATGSFSGKSLFVAVSHNGGRSWGVAHDVGEGGPLLNPGPNYALPTIAVDPARRHGPKHDRVYVAADTTTPSDTHPVTGTAQTTVENIAMSVSNDGGRTWSAPFNVNGSGPAATEPSQPVVGRNGAVYIAWREIGQPVAGSPPAAAANGFIVVAKSTNHGRTWSYNRSTVVQGYIYSGPPSPPFNTVPAVFTASTFPRLAIDRRRNDLYLVFGQGPPLTPYVPGQHPSADAHAADHFINPYSAVWFQRSTNGNRTWSTPKKINTAAILGTNPTQTRHPSVFVAPNGRVDIVWQDRRNWYHGCLHTHVACQEARLGDTYYAYSGNHGRGFSRNYRLSDHSTNNDVGYDYRFGTYWAYGPQVAPMGNNALLVAWMDSRLGNVQNDSQDIYLTRVGLHARGPVPVRRLRPSPSAANFSVALSHLAYPGGPEAVLGSTFVTRQWARVVIVNDHDVSGALAGGVLARANIGPVLASGASGLPARVKGEVARMEPVGAYVIGNTTQLSPQVVSDLAAAGVPSSQIVRLSGADVAGTAALIAEAADRRSRVQVAAGQPAFDAAIIANPANPDAVTAAALAADRRLPILYVNSNSIPAETSAALRTLNINRTLVVGGAHVIGPGVTSQLPTPKQVGGSNLYTTSRAVVGQSLQRGVPDNIIYVTNGRNLIDTALLGATLGRTGAMLLLSPTTAAAQKTIARMRPLNGDAQRIVTVR